jgi:hypothetical protein
MWQMAFLHDHAVKRLEAYFAPAIMAEKRQELSQRTEMGSYTTRNRHKLPIRRY